MDWGIPTLETYLASIYDDAYQRDDGQQRPRFKQSVELDIDRVNHILLYTGSFNPPHRGHLAVLEHAFGQMSRELNIVAAIIIPISDESLKKKCMGKPDERHLFNIAERRQLWMEDHHFPHYAWVFDGACRGYKNLMSNLKILAKKDRCRIRFVRLSGPDIAEVSDSGFSEMTIVSDVARQAEWNQAGRPEKFNNFGSWILCGDVAEVAPRSEQGYQETESLCEKEVQTQKKDDISFSESKGIKMIIDRMSSGVGGEPTGLNAQGEDTASNDPPGALHNGTESTTTTKIATDELLSTQIASLASTNAVFICWNTCSEPKKSFRFLCSTTKQHAPFRGISSTVIQRKMKEEQGFKLKATLEKLALSPGLLWEMWLPQTLRSMESIDMIRGPCGKNMMLCSARSTQFANRGIGLKSMDDLVISQKGAVTEENSNVLGKRKWVDQSNEMQGKFKIRKAMNIGYECYLDGIGDIARSVC